MNKVRKIIIGCVIALLVVASPFATIAFLDSKEKLISQKIDEKIAKEIKKLPNNEGAVLFNDVIRNIFPEQWNIVCHEIVGGPTDLNASISNYMTIMKKEKSISLGSKYLSDDYGALIFINTNNKKAYVEYISPFQKIIHNKTPCYENDENNRIILNYKKNDQDIHFYLTKKQD